MRDSSDTIDRAGTGFYPDPMSMVGEVLDGKYAVVRLIGEGGMGAVYEARHQFIGHRVAVKFLHPQYAANPQAVNRFYQEAQIAGRLGHDNICEVTDVGRTQSDMPYMVMPLLDGRTLADEVADTEGLLPIARVLDIIAQALNALERAHEAGIVHRDLKPENIFLTQVGDRADFVKILDFGISKIIGAAAPQMSALTATGMVVGTPYYMSVEQAQGAKTVDHRTDIYSIGVLLYELLTGTYPYDADSYNQLIVKMATEPFPPPRSVNPEISPEMERVILEAMHKSPQQRFRTAKDFRIALLDGARNTGLCLPPYATQADLSAEVFPTSVSLQATDDAKPLTLSQERSLGGHRRIWSRLLILGVVVGVGAAVLLLAKPWSYFQRYGSGDAEPDKKGMAPAASASERFDATLRRDERVTLRFVGLPSGGMLELDGQRVRGSQASVRRSVTPLRYRATAPGFVPTSSVVTPDRSREVRLEMQRWASVERPPARPTLSSKAKRKQPRRASPEPTRMRRPRRRARPRPNMVIMGRDGTYVDSDYDNP